MLNEEKLFDRLDKDLAWRKKELSIILNNIKNSEKENIFSNLRVGIAILYAHWEGYIKNSSTSYLEFIRYKKLNYSELSMNLIALSLKNKINEFGLTNKSQIHNEFVRFFIEDINKESKVPFKKAIQTKSNLNYKILQDIIIKLGLDYSEYELKKNLIDFKLLKIRNNVAHGNYIEIDRDEFLELYREIINIMDSFREQIIKCIKEKNYLSLKSKLINSLQQ